MTIYYTLERWRKKDNMEVHSTTFQTFLNILIHHTGNRCKIFWQRIDWIKYCSNLNTWHDCILMFDVLNLYFTLCTYLKFELYFLTIWLLLPDPTALVRHLPRDEAVQLMQQTVELWNLYKHCGRKCVFLFAEWLKLSLKSKDGLDMPLWKHNICTKSYLKSLS